MQENDRIPSFKLLRNENNSLDPRKNIPQFIVTFPDGENTTTNLSFFEAFPNSLGSKSCQYIGNLNNDPEKSVISASGCLHLKSENNNSSDEPSDENQIHFTLFSEKLPYRRFFTLDEKGEVKEVESDGLDDATMEFEKEYLEPSNLNSSSYKLEDAIDYQEDVTKQMNQDIKLNIAFGVDKSVQEYLGSHEAIQNWVSNVMVHMQAFYYHPTFKTRLRFEVRYIDF